MKRETDITVTWFIFTGLAIFLGIGVGIEHGSALGGLIVGIFCWFCLAIILAMGTL